MGGRGGGGGSPSRRKPGPKHFSPSWDRNGGAALLEEDEYYDDPGGRGRTNPGWGESGMGGDPGWRADEDPMSRVEGGSGGGGYGGGGGGGGRGQGRPGGRTHQELSRRERASRALQGLSHDYETFGSDDFHRLLYERTREAVEGAVAAAYAASRRAAEAAQVSGGAAAAAREAQMAAQAMRATAASSSKNASTTEISVIPAG